MKCVRLIEQRGYSLDLVDDDLCWSGGERVELFAEPFRPLDVAPIFIGPQQIEPEGVWKALSQEGRLACLARSPEEERLQARFGKGQAPRKHLVYFIMIIKSKRLGSQEGRFSLTAGDS